MRYLLFFLASWLASPEVSATDWEYYQNRINNCDRNDARCVGLSLLGAMRDSSTGGPGELSCICGGSYELICMWQSGPGAIPIEGGPILYTFSSDCQDNLMPAKNRGRACDGDAALWQINSKTMQWWKVADFVFMRECEIARDS